MALYEYQQLVKTLLLSGKSVILQAPTGAGKTRAALAPYIESFFDSTSDGFPRKCIYSVPMRVLANQFETEYSDYAESYLRKYQRKINVRIQTGERSEDRKFQGDLIFSTIDQSLSSALAVPYSLSPGMANLNAGAFFGSYLVFDEFHLFPLADEEGAAGALTTTLQLLMKVKEIVPFVLMTATFSNTMLDRLAKLLNAEVVQVSKKEYLTIATGNANSPRSRRYFMHDDVLSGQAILDSHKSRSIVICNQVKRAQTLFDELIELTRETETEVRLLHSRFTDVDRRLKEEMIRREFGKDLQQREKKSLILISTQVIEVGVDITSERLHSEIAPANSIFQRAGRCARYPGEQGDVHIYQVPTRSSMPDATSDTKSEGMPDFLPYQSDLCLKSWKSFQARDGRTLDFEDEQEVIDEVHTAADQQLLDAMERQSSQLWQDIEGALHRGERENRKRLIRNVDNITVYAATTPTALGNPFTTQGFGLWRGTVKGIFKELEALSSNWQPEEMEQNWLIQFPKTIEPDPEDPTEPIKFDWQEVRESSLLDATQMVVINSAFCAYDSDRGFRIVAPEEGGWVSPRGEFKQRNSQGGFAYKLESYCDHIGTMIKLYERDYINDYAFIRKRLSVMWNLPPEALDRAIRLAIALHDTAKMDKRWQRWVRLYHEKINDAIMDENYMAVHTNWNPVNPMHRSAKAQSDRQVKRPHHAGESAIAGARIINELSSGDNRVVRAVLTAIARHHSPHTESFEDYSLHPAAKGEIYKALKIAKLSVPSQTLFEKSPNVSLERYLIQSGGANVEELLLYFWVVRVLRLCDGLSQEE